MIQWYFFEKVYKRKVVLLLDMKVGPTELDLEMLRILHDARSRCSGSCEQSGCAKSKRTKFADKKYCNKDARCGNRTMFR